MTLGEKIKQERKKKNLTQEALAGTKITRNMLSAIEHDKASPSLDTLRYIAEVLDLPLPYLLSTEDNLLFYQKSEKIKDIRAAFGTEKYKKCIDIISSMSGSDDELAYIASVCYFKLGKESILNGSLITGAKYLQLSKDFAQKTVYDTSYEELLTTLFLAVAQNIKTPLLDLDIKSYEEGLNKICEIDFYKFIMQDKDHQFTNKIFSKHLAAKQLIKDMKLNEALLLLKELEAEKSAKNYNSYWVLTLYTDIESCYRQLRDFESAYRYAVKRMTLTEQFGV